MRARCSISPRLLRGPRPCDRGAVAPLQLRGLAPLRARPLRGLRPCDRGADAPLQLRGLAPLRARPLRGLRPCDRGADAPLQLRGLAPLRRGRCAGFAPATAAPTRRFNFAAWRPCGAAAARASPLQCRRRGSNPHGAKPHWILSPARLPVPPLRRRAMIAPTVLEPSRKLCRALAGSAIAGRG